MTTGKVEYAPDYKSERKYPNPSDVFKAIERRCELQRLKDEVVEAARAWRSELRLPFAPLMRAIDALEAFENVD